MLYTQKKLRIWLTIFFSFIMYLLVFSQNGDTIEIHKDSYSHKINFAQFQFRHNTDRHIGNGKLFLLRMLHAKPDDNLQLTKSETDQEGHTHQRYQQFYKDIKVEGAEYLTHSKEEYIYAINGHFADIAISSIIPKIDSIAALACAIKAMNAIQYSWSTKADKYYPKTSLVICKEPANESFVLAWKFTIIATTPMLAEDVYVDANTGNIINRISLIQDGNVQGTAETKYTGNQSIITDEITGGYRLRETQNNVTIQTMNFNHYSDPLNISTAADFINNTTYWASGTWSSFTADQPALDAHWGAEQVYNYWHTVFGRNSIDNNGLAIKSYIHLGTAYENAFWYSPTLSMYYGDGNVLFRPLTALDVCAHEFGHGICQYTANLSYQGESGALNEGFSDIWGACVEHWAAPNKQTWLMGEEITLTQPALRSMNDPKQFGQPDTYGGTNWYPQSGCTPSQGNDYCGVHINSGVLNKWFYLLSQGGSGTNDLRNSYSVSGITIEKAQQIAYKTESQYLYSSSDYVAARNGSIQAAIVLYGANSNEVMQTTNAWYAVGVGGQFQYQGSLSGPTTLCTTGTYTVSNLPIGASVTWSATPSGIVTLQPSGSSVTATMISSCKNLQISATINGTSEVSMGNISVGPPIALSIGGYSNLSYAGDYRFQVLQGSGYYPYEGSLSLDDGLGMATSYSWSELSNNSYPVSWTPSGNSVTVRSKSSKGYLCLTCKAKNTCGSFSRNVSFYTYTPPLTLTFSPNPAADNVVVSVHSDDGEDNVSTNAKNYNLKILDSYGKVYYMGNKREKRFSLSVSSLPVGVYTVSLSDGESVYQGKLMVKH